MSHLEGVPSRSPDNRPTLPEYIKANGPRGPISVIFARQVRDQIELFFDEPILPFRIGAPR